MGITRWTQVKALFDEALRLAEPQRCAFVRDACRDAPEVGDEVISLLRHHDPDAGFLEPPDTRQVAHACDALESEPRVGERVGAYRLTRLIASGGMGHVYLGERADGEFQRQVAIKIIRRSLDSPELRRRFDTEKQVLAGLDHPHIAKLLDGGVTDDGLSFLVMEYVDGLPFEEYCRKHQLGISRRLALFRAVCSASQYAHQRLVVHRDLKPANILVTEDGNPKLLDFGVAKLVDDEQRMGDTLGQSTPFFTPEYAAPEQILGEPITTACDVYALGVVLYHLLTGRLPYEPASASAHAFAQAVCEQSPVAPSRAVTLASVHDPNWSRQLAGDLDTIVCMALRKEPQRRYGSVEQFSEDIRRFLAGLPVIARKDTFTYRAKKFIGRNRFGVASAAAVCLAVVAVIVGTSLSLMRVKQAQNRTQRMNQFLQETLAQMDVDEVGRDLTLREVLDRAAARAEKNLAAYPDVLAGVHGMLGRAYLGQRYLDDARAQLEAALDINRGLEGNELVVAESLNDLSIYHHLAADDHKAIELCRAAIDLRRSEVVDDAVTADYMSDLSIMQKSLGQFVEAERLAYEALAIRRRLLPEDDPAIASSLNNIGVLLKVQGKFNEAKPVLEDALARLRAMHGNEHVEVANVLGNLANLLHSMGDVPAAEVDLRESMRINRALLPGTHPRIGITANNLARLLEGKGVFAEAEQLYRESSAISTAQFGADHPRTAISQHNLAMLLARIGRLAEAHDICTQALRVRRDALGPEHEQLAVSLDGLGYILLLQGEFAEAADSLHAALAMRRKLLSGDHPDMVSSFEHLAELNLRTGDLAVALDSAKQAVTLARRIAGENHINTARCLSLVGAIETECGELDAARAHLDSAWRVQSAELSAPHPDAAATLVRLAQWHLRSGDCRQARWFAREAEDQRRGYLSAEFDGPLRTVDLSSCPRVEGDASAE